MAYRVKNVISTTMSPNTKQNLTVSAIGRGALGDVKERRRARIDEHTSGDDGARFFR